jgi:hypothetical protein
LLSRDAKRKDGRSIKVMNVITSILSMDDLTFGASVWGSDDSKPTLAPPVPSFGAPDDNTEFDDFDDFDAAPSDMTANDDDFGDFGDFGDTQVVDDFGGGTNEIPIAGPSSHAGWQPLKLNPIPDREELQEQIQQIFGPLVPQEISIMMTDEPIKESQGYNQILVSLERYVLSQSVVSALVN